MAERRKFPRLRVLKSAKLILGNSAVFDCVVRNLTKGGARIELQNAVTLPQHFDLSFDHSWPKAGMGVLQRVQFSLSNVGSWTSPAPNSPAEIDPSRPLRWGQFFMNSHYKH